MNLTCDSRLRAPSNPAVMLQNSLPQGWKAEEHLVPMVMQLFPVMPATSHN